MRLAATEYDQVAALLERLTPEQWSAPTDCPGWDVRAMAGHMLGMAQMAASLPEMVRQQLAAAKRQKRDGGLSIDALTAVQVEKNAGLTTAEVVDAMRAAGPKAARARRRTPALVRNRTMPDAQDVAGEKEFWTVGFAVDTILTRDPFMHRIDICRAAGMTLDATADHEGHIVEDVVREWAGRHGASVPARADRAGRRSLGERAAVSRSPWTPSSSAGPWAGARRTRTPERAGAVLREPCSAAAPGHLRVLLDRAADVDHHRVRGTVRRGDRDLDCRRTPDRGHHHVGVLVLDRGRPARTSRGR